MKLARPVRNRETREGLLTSEETDESEKYWLKDAQSGLKKKINEKSKLQNVDFVFG